MRTARAAESGRPVSAATARPSPSGCRSTVPCSTRSPGWTAAPPGDPAHPIRPGTRLTGADVMALFEAQVTSRHLDLAARWLRGRGQGYYTIGSAGHEANAAVAAALRPTDPALLHYRSGAFYVRRAMQVPGHDARRDVLLGLVAATDEPMSGGRHKVFGHHDLAVIPQTSTIASHLPRALGVAFSIDRAVRLGVPSAWPSDAITVCSFGDASANHSTATGAINTACRVTHQHLPLPLLFVCEDNGLGISVRTPPGWIRAAYGQPRSPALVRGRRHRPRSARSRPPPTPPTGCEPSGPRRSSTFAPCGSWPTPARDVEAAYRSPAEIRGRLRAGPDPGHGPAADGLGRRDADGARPPLRADPLGGAGAGRGVRHASTAHHRRGGDGADGPPPSRQGRCGGNQCRAGRSAGRDVRRRAARGRGPADAGPVHQPRSGRPARPLPGAARVRRGRRGQGRRVRRDPRAAQAGRSRPRLRHGAGRAVHPRHGARRRCDRSAARTRDPVPGLPAQRRGPAPRRGGHTPVLLAGPVPQPAGRPHRRLRLPEGLRRALPQRRRRRRAPGHPRPGHRLTGPARRRRRHAAHLRGRGGHRRQRVRLPGTDRALPHRRPPPARRRRLAVPVRAPGAVDRDPRRRRVGSNPR